MTDNQNHCELNKLKKNLEDIKGKTIVVIGDLMLDHYLWGAVERISPEAPVPIVDVARQEYRLGGAANVVNNIRSLNANPIVVGIVGDDAFTEILTNIFRENQVCVDYIVKDSNRPTTVKSRIFAGGQQIMRFDTEVRQDISPQLEQQVIQKIDLALQGADALIIEDYNKGLLTEKIIAHSISHAKKLGITITVDPKYKNFFTYKHCTVFKPNFNELQKNLNIEINSDEDLKQAASDLFKRINPQYLVITLGEKGLKIFDASGNITHIPTFAREVFDVSGAGDTVISILTLCLSAGLDIKTSAIIANHAAGAVCAKRGIHPATAEDIIFSAKMNYELHK